MDAEGGLIKTDTLVLGRGDHGGRGDPQTIMLFYGHWQYRMVAERHVNGLILVYRCIIARTYQRAEARFISASDIKRFHALHKDIILKPLDGMGGTFAIAI